MDLNKLLKSKKLDAIFVSKKENIFWLTGFWCGEDPAFVILVKDKMYLFVSVLALESAKERCQMQVASPEPSGSWVLPSVVRSWFFVRAVSLDSSPHTPLSCKAPAKPGASRTGVFATLLAESPRIV